MTEGHEIVPPFTAGLAKYICAVSSKGERIAVAPKGMVHVPKSKSNSSKGNSRVTGLKSGSIETFEKRVASAEGVTAYVSFSGHTHGSHDTTLVNIISAAELERVAARGSRYSVGDSGNRLMFNYKKDEAESEGGPAQGVIEATLNAGPLATPSTQSKS